MERRGQCSGNKGNKNPPSLPLPPPRRAREERRRQASSGSFSASLLDAIYRSLDEDAIAVDAAAPRRRSEEKVTAAPPHFWWAAAEAGVIKPRLAAGEVDRAERRRREAAVARPRHSGYASSSDTSSSSSCSNGAFSCSSASTTDTESTVCRRKNPARPPRVPEESSADAAVAAAAQPPKVKRKSQSRPCFPIPRFRPRSPLSKSSPGPQPPSPATFACALKALFTSARLQRKPNKIPAVVPQPPPISPPSQRQTAGVPSASAVKAAVVPEPFRPVDANASVVRRRVEKLVRTLEELDEEEEGSDASSDLFELDSLRGAGAYELPVYGTTSLEANRAIAQRAAC